MTTMNHRRSVASYDPRLLDLLTQGAAGAIALPGDHNTLVRLQRTLWSLRRALAREAHPLTATVEGVTLSLRSSDGTPTVPVRGQRSWSGEATTLIIEPADAKFSAILNGAVAALPHPGAAAPRADPRLAALVEEFAPLAEKKP